MEENKYQNSCVYVILVGNSKYIGGTYNIEKRKRQHKASVYNSNLETYNRPLYKKIRENEGKYTYKILENVICNNRTELSKIENKYICSLKPDLNCKNSYRSPEELQQYKTAYSKLYNQLYYQKKKAKFAKPTPCEFCGKVMRADSIKNHQEKSCPYISSLYSFTPSAFKIGESISIDLGVIDLVG